MRKRMAASMILLVLALIPAGMGMVVNRCFELSLQRERERALSEETAIARAVALEIASDAPDAIYTIAGGLQRRYGSDTLDVVLVRHGQAMAGAHLPEHPQMDALLRTKGRATLLDGQARTLYIAHALSVEIQLLLATDVSPVYALRDTLIRWAAGLCAAGVALAVALSVVISGALMRPVRALSEAASAMKRGRYDAQLPAPGDDEIGGLTRAFSAMAEAIAQREDALRDQASRRQELIDAMAHEMRTPLTAILGGSRLLQQAKLPPEQRDDLLDMMAREAMRLSKMDERLLLLTRLEHEPPNMTAFSSLDMAREALAIFEGVVLEGEDASFFAERDLTIALLRNLVVNAKRAGGDMPVRVQLYADGFSVADHGCGMTQEQVARAFEPFYKADKARTREAGGAGLGLTLCHRIAQLHCGSLQISSEPGAGTTVVYSFVTGA